MVHVTSSPKIDEIGRSLLPILVNGHAANSEMSRTIFAHICDVSANTCALLRTSAPSAYVYVCLAVLNKHWRPQLSPHIHNLGSYQLQWV